MFTQSEGMRNEYCAQIVRIGKLEPIENSDFLVKTMIGGAYQVVVGKNDVKEGDIMVYCKLETEINRNFLSVNNQFEIGLRQMNNNYKEVDKLVDDGRLDEAKKLVGYFNKYGRVRIVKLRGCPSEGCLFTIDSLVKWNNKIAKFDFEKCFVPNSDGIVEPFNFDTIDGELFIKAYVPKLNNPAGGMNGSRRERKRNKRLNKFNRLIEGQFAFHYDTCQLTDNLWRFNPDTCVDISVKLHGTSHIVGNILVKKPLPTNRLQEIMNRKHEKTLNRQSKRLVKKYWEKELKVKKMREIKAKIATKFIIEYGKVTSSRSVIKNQYINKGEINHFYKPEAGTKDIWSEYGDLLYPYLEKGITVYSEIVGYVTNGNKTIQAGYDYGCNPGENYIMPYRITITDEKGNKTEFSVSEVYGWTINLLKKHPELKDRVKPITILYHGTLHDLYPEVPTDVSWAKNILTCLRNDKEHFGMEQNEPLCKNKVAREGIVIRMDNDDRAYKLKTFKFLGKEAELIDKGEVDIEMSTNYL